MFNTTYRTFAMGIVIHYVDHVRANGNTIVKPNSNEMSFVPGAMARMALARNRNPQEGLDLTANSHYELAFNEIYGGDKEGIDCISSDNGSIHHNYIHDQSGNGIYLDSWSLHQHDIEVASNRIDAVVLAGINLGTEGGGAMSRISIHHNIVSGARLGGIVIGESTWQKGNTPNPIFRDFSVKNDTVFGNQTGLNITAYPHGYATNIVVANNIFLDNSKRPITLNLPDYRERGILFENNLVNPVPSPENKIRGNERFDREEKTPRQPAPTALSPEKGDFRPMPGAAELRLGLGAITTPQAMIPRARPLRLHSQTLPRGGTVPAGQNTAAIAEHPFRTILRQRFHRRPIRLRRRPALGAHRRNGFGRYCLVHRGLSPDHWPHARRPQIRAAFVAARRRRWHSCRTQGRLHRLPAHLLALAQSFRDARPAIRSHCLNTSSTTPTTLKCACLLCG